MKAILEFDIPEDEYDHKAAVHSSELLAALCWLGDHFRRTYKHDVLSRDHAAWALGVYAEAVQDLPFDDL